MPAIISTVSMISKLLPRAIKQLLLLLLVPIFTACASSPPRSVADICEVFEDRRAWYRAAKDSERRWGVPIAVNMAIIYQESGFESRARPPRNRFLWIFPGRRPSSAFGFAQALDQTWDEYEKNSGNRRASRSNFSDAVDFVAWYNANSRRLSGISESDARNLYFAYHEGNGGYQRGSYREKQWLIDTASRVESNARRFSSQLERCERDLSKNWFQRLFS
jgi:hypothetical protein